MSMIVRKLVAVLGLKYNKGSFTEVNATLNTIKDTMGAVVDLFNMASKAFEEFLVVAARRESLEVSFGVLFNNVELGKQKLAELDRFAAETPLSVAQVRKNAVMLTAMGSSMKELIPEMKMLSNITEAFPNLTLERLALNFGQVRAQGHLTGREWRDFAVGGIDVLTPIGKKLGKTKTELRDMMSKKLISFDMVKAAFQEMTKEGGMAYMMLEKQAKTARGMWMILKSNVLLIKEAIGKELLPTFKKMLDSLIKWVKLNKDLIVEAVLMYLNTLLFFMKGIVWVIRMIVKLGPAFKDIVEALKVFLLLVGTISLGAVTAQFYGLIAGVGGLSASLWAATRALDAFLIKMTLALTPFVKAAGIFAAIGLGILLLITFFESADLYFRGLFEGFETKTVFGDIVEQIPILKGLIWPLIAALRVLVGLFLVLTTDMTWEQLANDAVIKKFSEAVREGFSLIGNYLETAFMTAWDTVTIYIQESFENVVNWFIDKLNFMINSINAVSGILPYGERLQISNIQQMETSMYTPAQGTKNVTNHIYANVAEGESGKFMSYINEAADEFNSGPMSYVEN